ncbi:uncharacterized mitochondrial protein AtMg00810-like [Humulus lupulus]|uniref:uncharacterized mitochondrial protein AtMg00810-like n=1 Tax=Humulus lupulus TaxID=3486 RepID=UPI002B4117D4|nr:uncharacterized mitochondrial protein AtMg00810-like [Humulus lupulus]
MVSGSVLSLHDGSPLADGSEYRNIVGAVQYCTFTRHDIAYCVSKLCQFMHQPIGAHWFVVKHLLRYLKGTPHFGLHFQKSSDFSLHCYTNADWASCPNDSRSTSGYCIFLWGNLVSWSSLNRRLSPAPAWKLNIETLPIVQMKLLG